MNQSTKHISAHAFKQLRQESADKLRIVDLRTHSEVNTERLEDCAHYPVQDLKASELKIYLQQQNHEPTQPIYLLCASGQRAVQAANQLQEELESQLVIIDRDVSHQGRHHYNFLGKTGSNYLRRAGGTRGSVWTTSPPLVLCPFSLCWRWSGICRCHQ